MSGKPQTLAEQIRALEPLDVAGPVTPSEAWEAARNQAAALADAAATTPAEHFDDHAVRQFSKMMAEKMAASRAKGRSGWDDPNQCSVEHLQALLHEHVAKGDPIDVANICMMLRHYEASTATTPVVGAEQTGYVRQAVSDEGPQMLPVRFTCLGCKHLHTEAWEEEGDNDHWDSGVTALCQKANMRIGHYWYEKTAAPDWCPCARITAALEPDPTPALGWRAMQTAAAEAVRLNAWAHQGTDSYSTGMDAGTRHQRKVDVDVILALPGPTDAQLLAEAMKLEAVRELVAAVKRLNDACDAMWNDHKRLEKNSGSFGQPYQIKELHIKAISEAQQALPDALAKIGGAA